MVTNLELQKELKELKEVVKSMLDEVSTYGILSISLSKELNDKI